MNTRTISRSRSTGYTMMLIFAALVGLSLITIAGHVQTETLHGAAHDTRHATGFPCH
jgi:cobalt transporter subunit CbtB